jgi:ferrous iron transport protein B
MSAAPPVSVPATRKYTIALVGNPNTGKTTLFNALSGLRQQTGNYPGVTVETKKGRMDHAGQPFDLIDLPGTYSLAPRSPDEMVAVDVILGYVPGEARPDVVLSIVDASNLERNLYLTTQAMELGVPVVIALNMIDVAEAHGVQVNVADLAQRLGVPVVPIQANTGKGLDQLRETLHTAANQHHVPRPLTFPEPFEREVAGLREVVGQAVPAYLLRRCLLDQGGYTEQRLLAVHGSTLGERLLQARQRLAGEGCAVPGVEARTRYGWIRDTVKPCVQRDGGRPTTWTDRLDRILTHRVWGTLIFLLVMLAMFVSIFWLARPFMKAIEAGRDWIAALVGPPTGLLPAGPLTSLLLDGLLKGVGSVVVFLPQILILFGFIAVLEDCGYMARAAYLMDRLMSRAGLSGKSFIPLLSSMACAVPGILATRVIENRRDRLATILVAPLMSCSARLPVYLLMIGAFLPIRSEANPGGYSWWVPGVVLFAMYLIGLVLAPLVAWVLKSTLLRGETPLFVMEMPLYKRPGLRTVVWRMLDAAGAFLRRAGTIILATMILVWALLYFPSGIGDPTETQAALDQAAAVLAKPAEEDAEEKRQQLTKEIDDFRERLQKGWATYDKALAILARVGVYCDERKDEEAGKELDAASVRLTGEWKRQSCLGLAGRWIEPAVQPLGWDWRIGTAALASFPAREVVVGTLGMLFDASEEREEPGPGFLPWLYESIFGSDKGAGDTKLARELIAARWDRSDRPLFTLPVALSLMVFFALCAQCASTLAVISRETGSTGWAVFTFVYMTTLAYVAALIVYQVGSRLG